MLRAEANILRFEQSQVNYTPPVTQQHTSSATANAINKRIEHNENDHKVSTSSSNSSSVAAKVTISQAAQNAYANAINKRIEHNENDHKISTPTSKPSSSVNTVTTKQVQDAYKKMSPQENNVLKFEKDHSDTTPSSAKTDTKSNIGGEVATNVLNLIPGIGNAKSLIESIQGKDMVTGAHLSGTDRFLAVVGTFIGGEDRELVKGAETVGKEIVKGTEETASQAAKRIADSIPDNHKDLLNQGFSDVSHPKAAEAGHTTYKEDQSGLIVRHDEGRPGATGHEANNHYHIENPNSTGKGDKYFDSNGNPVPKGSDASHIYPKNKR